MSLNMKLKSLGLLLLLAVCGPAALAEDAYYTAAYRAQVRPETGTIDMELNLAGEHLPKRIVLRADPQRYKNFTSTDPLQIGQSHVTWHPRGKMSRLRYQFVVDHERAPQRYDSLMTKTWTIFRGDKLVPRATVTARRGLRSRATLEFVTPEDWSVVTPYAPASGRPYAFDNPQRRFDRPEGWMLAGKIGSRGEHIGNVHVVIAAPAGDSARRQDMLAFLNWNLPRLQQVFPEFPHRLLIVTAGDPMWRGGLSGPASMFLHSDRPLISENRTSALLHELAHIAMGIRGDEESDWIVEGLAEFYSIETLRRSGSIGEPRYQQAVTAIERWARRAPTLFGKRSSGPTTARAVLTFRRVDAEIRKLTHDKASLDDVVRKLAAERGKVGLARLQKTAQEIAGRPLQSLEREQLSKPIAAPER
jgi:predicted metalloprotease with PDZ domain